MAENDVYVSLAAKLDYGESRCLPQLFQKLMTPEQARLALALPAPPEELAQRFNMAPQRVAELLNDLYHKGVIFPRNFQTREGYRFARSITQLQDASLAMRSLDAVLGPEYFELWERFAQEEWFPRHAEEYRH